MRDSVNRLIDKFTSGRWISTVFIVSTYCIIMLLITVTCNKLLEQGKDMGKELLIFIIGNFTGTAMGAVMAYHFKKAEERKEEKEPTK